MRLPLPGGGPFFVPSGRAGRSIPQPGATCQVNLIGGGPATIWTDNTRTATLTTSGLLTTRIDGTLPGFIDLGTYVGTWTIPGQAPFSHQLDMAGPQGLPGVTGGIGPALSVQGTYASGTTYSLGQSVLYSSKLYVSIVNGNIGNQPDTHPSQWAVVTAPLQAVFNVKDFGAALDGTTDDTAAIHAARDAAVAVGGGDVLIPYTIFGCKTSTGAQMKASTRLMGGAGPSPLEYNGYGTVLIGTSSTPGVKLPNTGVSGERAGCSITNLSITGCQDGIVALNGGVGLHLEGVYINATRYGISVAGFVQSWTGDRVEIVGGVVAFYFPPTAGAGGDAARMDDCHFERFYLNGQTTNAINVDVGSSTSVLWVNLRVVTTAHDGIVLAGGLTNWSINGWNCEAIGYAPASYVAPTTGTITLGAPTACTVASGAGIANGATVTVKGAGVAGADLISVVGSGGGTTSLVLATAASTAVAGAEVRIGTASEMKIVTSARGTPQNITITGHASGAFGNAGRGDCNVRYSIDNTPGALITLTGCTNTSAGQHYDPAGAMVFTDGAPFNSIRRPTNVVGLNDWSPWVSLPVGTGWSRLQSTLAWRGMGKQRALKGSLIAGGGASGTVCDFSTVGAPLGRAETANFLGNGLPAAAVTIDATHITTNVTASGSVLSFDGVSYWTDA